MALVFRVNGSGGASYSNSYSVDLEASSDQYLEASGSSAFDLSTYGESFSISMWVKPESLASNLFTMVSKGNAFRSYATTNFFYVHVGPTTTGPSENAYIYNGGSATGVWHHVVITYDGNSLNNASFVASGQFLCKIYRNATAGTSYRAQYVGRLTNSTSATNSNTFQIGGSDTSTTDPFLAPYSYSSFDGSIDEVSYWDKALSSTEVTELYNSGSAADLSSHSAVSNLVSWWRMGDNASDDLTADTGQITDVEGSNNLIPRNTTSSSKVEDTPGS